MLFDFSKIPAKDCYKLLVSTVTPRPIAWVVTQSVEGKLNVGAFSFFNVFSGDPPVLAIGLGSHKPGRPKDTRVNIKETGQFVVNLVAEQNAEQMNITAIEFDYGIDELGQAGLKHVPSDRVKPPRIAESPVSMECELMQLIEWGDNGMALGRILAMHVHDEMVLDAAKYSIDTLGLRLIGRMHGRGWYTRTTDLFEMPRIPVSEWKMKQPSPADSNEKTVL
jgi:flavin reductase (DIM6/NTAB) family NADH-FMN oxidoreductase RutF